MLSRGVSPLEQQEMRGGASHRVWLEQKEVLDASCSCVTHPQRKTKWQ